MQGNNLKICFACANIHNEVGSQIIVCPYCGNRESIEEYEIVLNKAREAVHYGWNYRLRYEKDLKEKGRIDTYCFLEQSEEILNFIAVAIASGVIGGFAYDVVKKVITKILKFIKENGNEEEKNKIFSLVDNDEDMRTFIEYIDEYYTCFEKIDDEVRNAIFEEMVVDKISPTLEKYISSQNPDIDISRIKEISPFSEEEIFKSMIEVRQKLTVKKQVEKEMFKNFWTDIDK